MLTAKQLMDHEGTLWAAKVPMECGALEVTSWGLAQELSSNLEMGYDLDEMDKIFGASLFFLQCAYDYFAGQGILPPVALALLMLRHERRQHGLPDE